ncbi:DnaJ-like protein 60 [Toxocara canis]|uniref:DnaJ-like protein 60 n=1 Tax=Toxocara canis TaxID=6265 RepID=A0A0B2UTW2_TOXCA|nr:DnaJ-like protein 60 [Toxocara canis]
MRCSSNEKVQLLFVLSGQRAHCGCVHYGTSARTHYEVLGVRQDASLKEIKNAFYTLSKKYHPDVAGSRSDTVTTINFMAIKDAYDVLRDPEKRRTYDKQLSPRNTYQFESPSTQAPFGYPFTQRSESRRAPPPPRQTYTQAEYQRMFDQFRKRYESDAYQAFQEEMRQRAWEEQLRRRNEFLRRQSARYSHRRDFFRRRHEDTDFSRFDFVGSFGYNFEMLNKVLTVYLVVFFAVAITSAIYQRIGGFEFRTRSTVAQRSDEEQKQRIDGMMAHAPLQRPSSPLD